MIFKTESRNFIRFILPFFWTFVVINLIERLAFTQYEILRGNIDLLQCSCVLGKFRSVFDILLPFFIGFISDSLVFSYILVLLAICFLLLDQNKSRIAVWEALLFFIYTFILVFTAVAEWFFWNEFGVRFNFIAVDYLIYSKEVIGNIRESYPINLILVIIGIFSVFSAFLYKIYRDKRQYLVGMRLKYKAFIVVLALALSIITFGFVDRLNFNFSHNKCSSEIAKNGIYQFFSAYRNNELPFDEFYITKPQNELTKILVDKLSVKEAKFLDPNTNIIRTIQNQASEKNYNVVVIIVESLSAEYLGAFGNKDNLTPNLNAIVKNSLSFNNIRAIGTRTVYGLAGITLSIPPLPGNSIVRRPGNDKLFNIGTVFKDRGYVTKFLYGGFGYFDNMNNFFSSNGYQVIDRSDLAKNEITFSNIWGVADEDLFARVIKENDLEYTKGNKFFDVIMTTSNHRPFTYPDGKIDIPSHTGRSGGVKYTDYAIHTFIENAKKREWFNDTVFVIVADHTAGSAGRQEINPNDYLIPMIFYAPKIIKPAVISKLGSQIDLGPTLLGLLDFSYESKFFGHDLLKSKIPERAFISNYQQVGYMTNNEMVVLKPQQQFDFYQRNGQEFELASRSNDAMLLEALAYFQSADNWSRWNKE